MNNTIVNPSDPRIVKTKKQFKIAFKELVLIYDDFMSITVKELCDKANLNRKTFYSHYKQVDELLIEVQDDYIQEFYNRTKDLDFYSDAKKVVEAYFDLNDGDQVYKKMAITSVYFFTKEMGRKRIIDFFRSKGKFNNGDEHNATVIDFLSYFYDLTIYTMYKRWVTKNYPLSKEETIAITANLLKNGLSTFN